MTLKTFAETKAGYTNLWAQAKVPAAHHAALVAIAQKIKSEPYWSAFKEVETATGVPAEMVGGILYRESSLNLDTYLGNGQSLHHVTTVEPIGRGPWPTFKAGAVDALTHEGMTGITTWTVPLMLYWAERFNGQGYFSHGNSPYIWSWTDQYHGGMFPRDHFYDPSAVDPRPGVAAILKVFYELNPDLSKETTPMATTTTVAVPTVQIPHIDFATIEKMVETAAVALPIISAFIPGLKPFLPIVPVLEQLLKAADQVQQTHAAGGDIWSVIAQHLHTVADQLKAASAVAQPVQAASAAAQTTVQAGASTQGMPNS